MKQLNQLVCGNESIFRSIQRSSEKAVNRLMACSVVQKCLMFIFALTVSVGEAMAGSKEPQALPKPPRSEFLPDSGVKLDESDCSRYSFSRSF